MDKYIVYRVNFSRAEPLIQNGKKECNSEEEAKRYIQKNSTENVIGSYWFIVKQRNGKDTNGELIDIVPKPNSFSSARTQT